MIEFIKDKLLITDKCMQSK